MEFQLYNGEKEELVNFLCSNEWKYHSTPNVENEKVKNSIEIAIIQMEEKRIGLLSIQKK